MAIRLVIPARFDSERLPGKVLKDIGGKPLVQHVYERACEVDAESVVIATDSTRVLDAAQAFGAEVILTSRLHRSGTERLNEVVTSLNYAKDDIVVNVQGDDPLIPPKLITQVARDLQTHTAADIATLYCRLDKLSDVMNPNVVKVIVDQQGFAIYFSRAPVPWLRGAWGTEGIEGIANAKPMTDFPHCRHVGLYAYRADFIKQYVQWEPSALEQDEGLEQLRVLYYGGRIHLSEAEELPPIDVNSAEDLEQVRQLIAT